MTPLGETGYLSDNQSDSDYSSSSNSEHSTHFSSFPHICFSLHFPKLHIWNISLILPFRRHVWLLKPQLTRVWQRRIRPGVFLPSDLKWVAVLSLWGLSYSAASAVWAEVNIWKLTVVLTEAQIKTEKGESRLKRPRGRPPKVCRENGSDIYDNPKKNKHGKATSREHVKLSSKGICAPTLLICSTDSTLHLFCIFIRRQMRIWLTCLLVLKHGRTQTHMAHCRSLWTVCLQHLAAHTCGSSSGISSSTPRGTRAWWSGRIAARACSSSSSPRLWLRCGVRRRRTAAWRMRSSAVQWGEFTWWYRELVTGAHTRKPGSAARPSNTHNHLTHCTVDHIVWPKTVWSCTSSHVGWRPESQKTKSGWSIP